MRACSQMILALAATFTSFGFGAEASTTGSDGSCAPIQGASEVLDLAQLESRRFIVFGEWHGTVEAPSLFGQFVCEAARRKPLSIILEFPVSVSNAVSRYVSSQGTAADRRALDELWIWQRDWADGRNSNAVRTLIEELRSLRQSGLEFEVYTGQPDTSFLPGHYYELAMASRWSEVAGINPNAVVLILTGIAHVSSSSDDEASPYQAAVSFLNEEDVIALSPEAEGGFAMRLRVVDGEPVFGLTPLVGSARRHRSIGPLIKSDGLVNASFAVGRPYTPSSPAITKEE